MNLFNVDDDINYLLLTMGKSILINSIPATAIIGYSNIKEYEEKKIITKTEIKRGDLFEINNHNYLIVNEINDKRQDTYYKGYARSCNCSIKFNFNGSIKEFPAILTTKVLDTIENKYVELVDGKIQVILKDTVFTKEIALQQRFLKMGYAYSVTGIDMSNVGLIYLNCDVTDFSANDDKDNEIVDRWLYEVKHSYTIETTNIDSSLEQEKTLQFVVTIKDNETVISNPTIIYSASNTNCLVDANGLITAKTEGNCIITASFTGDDGTVKSASITITVIKPVIVVNYSVAITGSDTLKQTQTLTYTASVTNNGTATTNTVVWSVSDTTKVQIISQDGTSIKLKGLVSSGTVTLTATINGRTEYIEKIITLKSAF